MVMKNLVLILILHVMCANLMSQNQVYDSKGTKKHFTSEDIDIVFTVPDTPVIFPPDKQEAAGALIGILPTAVSMVFQLTTNILESRTKKFTAEYTKTKSFLEAGDRTIPNIEFERRVGFSTDATPNEPALSIKINAAPLKNIAGFVYYIESIYLKYSSAKAISNHNTFDYSIEIKPTFLIKNEKKVIDITPIAVSSVQFDKPINYEKLKHRTDFIPLPKGAILTEVSLKIVESNPIKVRAEKVLSTWNTYKDSTRTIINNFLPKEPSSAQERGNTPIGNK